VTIFEIFKRKLINLKHNFEISWENCEEKKERVACLKVIIFNSQDFTRENENKFKSKLNSNLFFPILSFERNRWENRKVGNWDINRE